ncbi:MAG: hypothetical protein ACEPOZ_17610 [Marinifilaceae bacterium]
MSCFKPKYLKEKYKSVLCLFFALILVETISGWSENYFLSKEYSAVVGESNYSFGITMLSLFRNLIFGFLNLSIFVVVSELLGKKWFVIPISILSSFILNYVSNLLDYSHLYFDIRGFNWLAYLFYSVALFALSYTLVGKSLKTYYSFAIFYLLFLSHRIGSYLGVGLLTGYFPDFLNAEFFRFLFYSILFGGLYLVIHFFMEKTSKDKVEIDYNC